MFINNGKFDYTCIVAVFWSERAEKRQTSVLIALVAQNNYSLQLKIGLREIWWAIFSCKLCKKRDFFMLMILKGLKITQSNMKIDTVIWVYGVLTFENSL